MKKVLTVLLAIAVVFTFSFGTSFATLTDDITKDEIKDITNALKAESQKMQESLDSAKDSYIKSLTFDDDGFLIATPYTATDKFESDLGYKTGVISKAVIQAKADKVVDEAKNAFDKVVAATQKAFEESVKADPKNPTLETVAQAKQKVSDLYAEAAFITFTDDSTINFAAIFKMDEVVLISDADYNTDRTPEVVEKQYKADMDEVTELLNGYKADADKYSDNLSDKKYAPAKELVENDNTGNNVSYIVWKVTGDDDANGKDRTAKDFIKDLVDHQLAELDKIDSNTYTQGVTTKKTAAGIEAISAIKTLAKDIVKGHKAGTGDDDYYVEAVPTKEESTGEGLTADKNRAIRLVKANVNAGVVAIEKMLNDELTKEQKKAKPDTTKVKDLKEALDDLNGQVAAVEEVVAAVINYAESSDEVENVKKALLGQDSNLDYGVLNLSSIVEFDDADNSYTDFQDGAQKTLKAAKKISENVAALEKEAELVKAQLEVNGQNYVDPAVLADNLDEQKENLYKVNTTNLSTLKAALDTAKRKLWNGNEIELILTKQKYVDYINGDATEEWYPEDKNGNDLKYKNANNAYAWNKANAERTIRADETVAVMPDEVSDQDVVAFKANSLDGEDEAKVDVYDDAQADALKALVAETEKAIKEAKTVAEVKAAFVAAHAKYEDIDTTADHLSNWAKSKPIGKEYDKQNYDGQLYEYIQYIDKKVDFTDDYYFASNDKYEIYAEILDAARAIMFKAYSKDELAAKFDEAKTMIEKIPTKSEIKNAKKAVEDLINALPATITLADKDAIVKAADALSDYYDMLGTDFDNQTDPKPSINNETKLVAAKTSYEKLAADELDDAYRALQNKDITIDDTAAVEALRKLYDDYCAFYEDYCDDDNIKATTIMTLRDKNLDGSYDDYQRLVDIEDDLSDAKVAHARELIIKLPANPTLAKKADVEAARAYYESLTLAEKARVLGTPQGLQAYKCLLDAEEALGLNTTASVKELKITAKSTAKKGSITVKWTVKGDASAIDGYEVWKSKKHSSGYFKAMPKTTKQSYKNTKGLKKGTRYYYKVRAFKMVDGKKITSDWSNKARRIAK